jgi:hypothetical protein
MHRVSSSRRRFFSGLVLVVAAGALLLAAAALAGPALPKTGSAYSTGGIKHGVSVTLVTSATDPKAIEAGEAATASQYALSGGAVLCPKSKKNPGFHETPFAVFGFPGATLKLSHGAYGFSKTVVQPDTSTLGGTAKPFKLKVKITGSVLSSTKIVGTVKSTGGPCTTKKALKYTAKLDTKLPVAPGQ